MEPQSSEPIADASPASKPKDRRVTYRWAAGAVASWFAAWWMFVVFEFLIGIALTGIGWGLFLQGLHGLPRGKVVLLAAFAFGAYVTLAQAMYLYNAGWRRW